MTGTASSVAERLANLLQHLGLHRVHVAAGFAPNAVALARSYPESVASITLVCPMQMPAESFLSRDMPVLVFFGDRGSDALTIPRMLAAFPEATGFPLR